MDKYGTIAGDSTTAQEGQNKILRAKLLLNSRMNSVAELDDCLVSLWLYASKELRDYEIPKEPRRY